MSVVAAAERVLRDAGEPLHYGVVTARMLDRGLWKTTSTHPDATVNRQIAESIRRHGGASPIVRISPGVYTINDRVVPLPITVAGVADPDAVAYLDAAHAVLAKHADRSPMHFVEITQKALSLGLIETTGQPHEALLYAQIVADVNRASSADRRSRFTKLGSGMVGLARWQNSQPDDDGLQQTKETLLASLFDMEPAAFELTISQVLAEIGFDGIDIAAYHGDQGFDARAILEAAGFFPIRMIVHVKRWKRTVGVSEIQRARDAAGVDEHPLILTTSGFTKAAFVEAQVRGAKPVGLIAGSKLASLMMEHSVGVQRRRRDVYEPAPETPQLTFNS